MTTSTPTALQNLGTLIFSDHALHLQQQLVLRRAASRAVQEQHLGPGTVEFLHQQRLVSVTAGQPVGREDIKPPNASRCRRIAQPLQRGADKEETAVALIDIGVIGLELPAIAATLSRNAVIWLAMVLSRAWLSVETRA